MLLVIAGGLRFSRLDFPNKPIFDETYYAKDACLYTGASQKACDAPQATEQSYVHPPLGKWLIAGGIKIFGYNSFGWRSAAALFGTLLVLLVYALARKLFRDRWIAAVAGFLVATDFLLIVQSRVAMLDIFLTFFIVLGFLFLAFDRERILLMREHLMLPFHGPAPMREPEWRVLAGAALGMALATKWSAVWAIVAAIALTIAWSFGLAKQRQDDDGAFLGADPFFVRELAGTFLSFVAVPLVVYLFSYATWFASHGPSLTEFFKLQKQMLEFHSTLTAKHAYQSEALTWPLILRPVAYYWEGEPLARHILAFANPGTWWAAIPAGIWLLVRSYRRWRPERFVIVGWLVQYGAWVALTAPILSSHLDEILFLGYLLVAMPWIVYHFMKTYRKMRFWSTREIGVYAAYLFIGLVGIPLTLLYLPLPLGTTRPAIFFFYMTPIVPFMMIGLAATLGSIRDIASRSSDYEINRVFRVLPALYLAGVTALVVYFIPVVMALGLTYSAWTHRMWFNSWI